LEVVLNYWSYLIAFAELVQDKKATGIEISIPV
jgi:hypothetical protein